MSLKRSDEPFFWLMFGGGGVVAAFVIPALVLVLALFAPAGWMAADALSYERIQSLSSGFIGKTLWLVIIAFPLWHALHRINHLTHDLKLGYSRLFHWLCYGAAAVATVATMTLLMVI